MLHSHPPQLLGAGDPQFEGEEEGTGPLGLPTLRPVEDQVDPSQTLRLLVRVGKKNPAPGSLWPIRLLRPREGKRLVEGHTVAESWALVLSTQLPLHLCLLVPLAPAADVGESRWVLFVKEDPGRLGIGSPLPCTSCFPL